MPPESEDARYQLEQKMAGFDVVLFGLLGHAEHSLIAGSTMYSLAFDPFKAARWLKATDGFASLANSLSTRKPATLDTPNLHSSK